ncbi:hypothetical protein AB0P37_08395 [Streptomyces antimycoticus]|uniref:hypothetical protein n=1 Tax=Streptomyces antimycoticus TaxID=68175 RepID=UPI00343077ED
MLYEIVVYRPDEDSDHEVIGTARGMFLADFEVRQANSAAERDGVAYRHYYRPAR